MELSAEYLREKLQRDLEAEHVEVEDIAASLYVLTSCIRELWPRCGFGELAGRDAAQLLLCFCLLSLSPGHDRDP